ncbi:MAG: SGNH/GDSL hydrolase family protein [Ruminococcaceae bacterium]|nr:SGNH/GDSL hydrolase family protein [Oscillospiraceae bacterium]
MKKTRRIVSFILSLVMLLPLIAIAVTAEETDILWEGENFDAGTWSNMNSWPVSAEIVSKSALNPSDKALKIDIKGVAAASRTAPYYAWGSDSNIYEITDYSYEAATNTVSGNFSDGTATHAISGTLDTGVAATCDAGTYYVYTPDMVDARTGYNNVAKAAVVRNPLISATTANKAVFQYKIWFEEGSKGIFASRAYTSGGKYVEFFGMKATGTSVTLQQHENAQIAAGSAVTFKTGEWHTISVALDFYDRWYDVYLDGVYAFSAINNSGDLFELPIPFDIGATKWNLIQINRRNTSAASLAGSLMIDDVCIYDGSILDAFTPAPAIEVTDDFESYTVDKITKTEGYNLSDSGNIVAYNKVLSENLTGSSNKFVRVPLLYDGTGSNVIGTAGYTNYDKTLTLAHPQMTKENGEYAVFEIDYRHNAEANCTNGTIETQLYTFNFDMELSKGAAIAGTAVTNTVHNKSGIYLSLFTINLKDGSLVGHDSSMTKTGAAGLKENEWNTIRYVLNLRDTSYYLYVNGILYGYDDAMESVTASGWSKCTNVSNLKIPANNLIISKVNKKDNTGNTCYNKVGEANETYSNVNYIDVDNVTFSSTNEAPVIVLPPVTAENDFEGYSDQQTLTTSNGFAAAPPYNMVLSETVDGKDNKFVRVPFLYGGDSPTSGTTNRDKSFYLKHSMFNKDNGRYMIYEADFRRNASAQKAVVQLQLASLKFEDASGTQYNGSYLALFSINLQTGDITGHNSSMTKTGAEGLTANEWTRVKFVLDLENPSYRIYVNGVTYGYGEGMQGMYYSANDWVRVNNIKNIEASVNSLIVAKVDKDNTVTAAYTKASDADATYSNVNYVDLDNLNLITSDTMPPIVFPPIEAEEGFESGTAGSALSSSNSSTNTAYNKVLSETVGEGANQFLRVPLLYDGTGDNTISTGGYTNYDKTVTMKHATISTDTGKYAVFTVDYRPHAEANAATGTIEIQINGYKFDALVENGSQKSVEPRKYEYSDLAEDEKGVTGIFLKLFDINLATGELTGNSSDSLKKTGAKGLNLDEWNTIQFVMNLEDSSSCLYVNGYLYGVSEKMHATSNGWYYYTNPSNIVFTSNCLFAAKVNKKDEAFNKLGEADETYSNVNYIDIDNISIASATEKDITVLDPVNEDGGVLMYVEVKGEKVANEYLYLTKDIEYEVSYFDPNEIAYDGIISTVDKSSIRLKGQAGLRFATEIVDMEAFDALFALEGEDYKDVTFGTLIVPTSYVSDIDFTVDSLKIAGRQYLEVEANYGHYYAFDNDDSTTHFVGSIVNLRSGNVNRPFSAIGYIKITLWGGQEYYFYSSDENSSLKYHTANVQEIATLALNDKTQTWTEFEKSILDTYAEGNTMDATIANDMKGLNVLAFGDSLFGGTIGYDQATQWVNKLGVDNEWNLTNLGIGSMTVSLTERNNVYQYGNKNSMYDWMFNEKNDFRWNSTATPSGTNPFFKTGVCTDNKGDVELIILEGGCNDYGTAISAPLGTVDSHDPGTFLGAWNCITERLLEEYENATIVFLTTWRLNPQTRTDDTLTSIEFSESVITLYEERYASNDRIALIDAGDPKVSGVDMLDSAWRTEYSTDSYHLKDTGMAVMADHMLPLLWEIVMKAR